MGYEAKDHPQTARRSGSCRGRPRRCLQRHAAARSGHDYLADADDDCQRDKLRHGDGVNDACACDADAHVYCAGFYAADWQSYARAHGYTTASWKYGLLDCLGKHNVSAACKVSLDRREALNAQMMAACATYCRGTSPQPGAEPCVDRLKSIYDSLDNACRTALDAHEAAKALGGRSAL